MQAAGIANFLPATGATLRYQVKVDGLAGPNQDRSMTVGTCMIGGGYLRAIRAPLLMGSWCPALTMDFERPHEAMVNQRFLFASAAVTLAAIGLYNLFMLVVSGRSREMAVMLAIVSLLAVAGPAFRAARVAPLDALKSD